MSAARSNDQSTQQISDLISPFKPNSGQRSPAAMKQHSFTPTLLRVLVVALHVSSLFQTASAFSVPQQHFHSSLSSPSSALYAKKQNKATKSKNGGGGGFGASKPATTAAASAVSADVNSLESQWDNFASITNLEIQPLGNPDDDDYGHFIVTDVFVRVGSDNEDDLKPGTETGWYRTGKVVASGETDIHAALTLQKGLILWTAVHMWPQLAAKGKAAARFLQLGYMPPSMNMASESDPALDEDEALDVLVLQKVQINGVPSKDIGFRPDFNPPGFSYKRREKAAMKKKRSALDEIVDAS